MYSLLIEKITIPYKKDLLTKWKERNSSIVPAYALEWKGNGVSNGYGFGEWMAERFFRSKGYYIINDEFDLFSKTSKYKTYNDIISLTVGSEKVKTFRELGKRLVAEGYGVENVDLFIFNTNTFFFAEVKKERDTLRESQLRFMHLAKEILNVDSKLVYLAETASVTSVEYVNYTVSLPENLNSYHYRGDVNCNGAY